MGTDTVANRRRRVTLPDLYPIQARIAAHPSRFKVVVAGRRFGKSRMGMIIVVAKALRGMRCWWVAPTYKLSAVLWRDLKELLIDLPGVNFRETDKLVEFPSGGSIQVRSAVDPDSLRGDGLDFAVLDEAAFMKEAAWTDGIRPALSDRRGGAMFLSTPCGRNWFWRAYQRGRDPLYAHWQYWHCPTAASGTVPPDEIRDAQLTLPARVFAQEYMAAFLEGAGAVFRHVRRAAKAPMPGRKVSNQGFVMGIDWGKEFDFTVLTVFNSVTRQMVDFDRFNQIDYRLQKDRVKAMSDKWKCRLILAEQNSMGTPLVEDLIAAGLPVLPYYTTNASKADMIERLQMAFERNRITIQPHDALIDELEAFTMTMTGHLRRAQYSAPSGAHDDCVISLALANYAMQAELVPNDNEEVFW